MLVPRPLLAAPALALAYFALSMLGLLVVDQETQVAFLWPASALGVLVLAWMPTRSWPALLLAIAAGNAAAEFWARDAAPVVLGITLANTLEPVVAVSVYRAVAGVRRLALDTPRGVLALLAGALAGTAASGAIAITVLHAAQGVDPGPAFLRWWLADLIGITAVAPITLLRAPRIRPQVSRLECAGITLGAVATALFIFWRGNPASTPVGSYPFLITPALLWAALRLRQARVAGLLVITLGIALAGTLTGHGPFSRAELSADHRAFGFQLFLICVTFCTLFTSAVTVELHRATRRAASERERLRSALAHHEMVVQHLPEVVIGLYDRSLRCQLLEGGAIAGSAFAEASFWEGRSVAELFPADAHEIVLPAFETARDEGRPTGFDWRSPYTDRLFAMQILPVLTDAGEVDHLVCVGRDVTAIRAQEHELRDLADRDSLTGALNRRSFGALVAAHLETTRDDGSYAGAVAVIDLDGFKPVNDRHGHAIGDEVLRSVVTKLERAVGADGQVARIGGDEFAVLFPTLERAARRTVADRLQHAIAQVCVPAPGELVGAAGSVGLAMHADHPDADPSAWVAAADAEMYLAKRARQTSQRVAA